MKFLCWKKELIPPFYSIVSNLELTDSISESMIFHEKYHFRLR